MIKVLQSVRQEGSKIQTFIWNSHINMHRDIELCFLSFAPAVNINEVVLGYDNWAMNRVPSVMFHVCCVLTEQHIMETTVVSGVYLPQRRGHLQTHPLPQPTVWHPEGKTLYRRRLGAFWFDLMKLQNIFHIQSDKKSVRLALFSAGNHSFSVNE